MTQVLRNKLGLPYQRGRRRRPPEPLPKPEPELEDYVSQYQATRRAGNVFGAERIFDTIWTAVKPLFVARGVPETEAESTLLSALSNYDIFAGKPFVEMILTEINSKYKMTQSERETDALESASYRQNGLTSYLERESSNPEILAVSRADRAANRIKQAASAAEYIAGLRDHAAADHDGEAAEGAADQEEKQAGIDTAAAQEPVNSSDQDESEPETAPEADQDETEPETTPEPETEIINGIDYHDFLAEIVQSWE